MSQRNLLSRRAILRGAGAALSLPLLDAMAPVKAIAAGSESMASLTPVRMAWVFFPNGTNAQRWLTEAEGDTWKVAPSLEPLAELRNDVSVLRGLSQINAQALGDGPGDHARSAAAFLTGTHPYKTAGSRIKAGKSIDQVLADEYGRSTRLPSIELGTEEGRNAGSCDSGYACAYSNNISWRSESQPMAKEIKPRMAFERLFGTSSGEGADAAKRMVMKKSILDSVRTQSQLLTKKLGVDDKQKLDEYFTSIRDVEMRLERASQPIALSGDDAKAPPEKPADFGEQIRLMYDLMVLAFRTDTTRLASFMVANEGSNRAFPMIEIKEGHHELSHHQDKQDSIEKIAKIDRYYTEQFAYFIKKLKETPDGNGCLLDNSMIVYGGAISDGNRHDHHDLPILLAGRGGNRFESGKFHRFADNTPLNNLFLTMADVCGVQLNDLGDSTGRVNL